MVFKKYIFVLRSTFFLFFLLGTILPASAAEMSAKTRIEQMVHSMRGHINVSEYEMTITRPSWTRTLTMKVWDDRKNSRVFVRILSPAKEKDTAFLRLQYNLWNYLPAVEKVMKIPPSMMLQPWMGSDFTNDDLVKEGSYIEDYDHVIGGQEDREGQKIVKVELKPHPQAPVVWGKVIFFLREKDNLPVEQQFLDEHGTLVKDLKFSEYKTVDGVLTPTFWEMSPLNKPGQKTAIKILNIDFDPSPQVPESTFTEKNLKP